MSSDESLFGDKPIESAPPQSRYTATQDGIAAWQVEQIRQALTRVGVDDMTQRRQTIEDVVGRSVEHIRHLRFSEAQTLLEHLSKQRTSSASSGSAWDHRDEDTWIDRL